MDGSCLDECIDTEFVSLENVPLVAFEFIAYYHDDPPLRIFFFLIFIYCWGVFFRVFFFFIVVKYT